VRGAVASSGALMRRGLNEVLRVPGAAIPGVLAPSIFMLGITSVFGRLTHLPGFPTDQYLSFIVPITLLQAAGFSGAATGVNLARDIELGWFDRLLVSPVPRWALLGSTLASGALRAVLPITFALVLAFSLGVPFPGVGPLALAVLLALAFSFVAAGWGVAVALRFKTQSAAPLMQAGIFMLVLFTPSYAPQPLLTGVLADIASVNPVRHVVEGIRQVFVGDVTWAATWPALVVLAALVGLLAGLALWMLERSGR
jgi:ABC-type multidrug transport system permease subunit